jgi:hypothetical protein
MPLLAGLLSVSIALGQRRRTMDARTYGLLVTVTAGVVGAALSWLYLFP